MGCHSFLTIGLYNMFKNPQSNIRGGDQIIFSDFLTSVDNGEVLKVERYKEIILKEFIQMVIVFLHMLLMIQI